MITDPFYLRIDIQAIFFVTTNKLEIVRISFYYSLVLWVPLAIFLFVEIVAKIKMF